MNVIHLLTMNCFIFFYYQEGKISYTGHCRTENGDCLFFFFFFFDVPLFLTSYIFKHYIKFSSSPAAQAIYFSFPWLLTSLVCLPQLALSLSLSLNMIRGRGTCFLTPKLGFCSFPIQILYTLIFPSTYPYSSIFTFLLFPHALLTSTTYLPLTLPYF